MFREISQELMRRRRSEARLSFYLRTGHDIEQPLPTTQELIEQVERDFERVRRYDDVLAKSMSIRSGPLETS